MAIALTTIVTAALAGPVSGQRTIATGEMNELYAGFGYGPIILERNGTGATLNKGVTITGVKGYAPIAALLGTTVVMRAGSALNGLVNDPSISPNPMIPGMGLQVSGASFYGYGGTVQGGSSFNDGQTEPLGSLGAFFNGSGQFSGTSFYGGASPADEQGGAGAEFIAGEYTISAGTFQGGSGGVGGTGAVFNFTDNNLSDNLQISGGLFQGGQGPDNSISGNALVLYMNLHHDASISGGDFVGSSSAPGPSGDGYALYLGSLYDNSYDGNSLARSHVDVTGGRFVGDMYFDLSRTDVHFFGSGFSYDPTSGEFKGRLLDGTSIDTMIVDGGPKGLLYIQSGTGEVTFSAVPEPSSIVLLSLGAAGVGLVAAVRRRGRRGGAGVEAPEILGAVA